MKTRVTDGETILLEEEESLNKPSATATKRNAGSNMASAKIYHLGTDK